MIVLLSALFSMISTVLGCRVRAIQSVSRDNIVPTSGTIGDSQLPSDAFQVSGVLIEINFSQNRDRLSNDALRSVVLSVNKVPNVVSDLQRIVSFNHQRAVFSNQPAEFESHEINSTALEAA